MANYLVTACSVLMLQGEAKPMLSQNLEHTSLQMSVAKQCCLMLSMMYQAMCLLSLRRKVLYCVLSHVLSPKLTAV